MDCSRVRDILLENPDTEIPEELRQSVEAHLAVCQPCATHLATLREQLQALGSLPRVKAPDDFLDRIHEQIERPSILEMIRDKLAAFLGTRHLIELAGVAVTVVFVLVTYQVVLREGYRERTQIAPAPATAPGKSESTADERAHEKDMLREERKAATAPESAAPRFERQQETVELDLRLPGASAGAGVAGNALAPPRQAEGRENLASKERAAPAETKQNGKGPALRDKARLGKLSSDVRKSQVNRALTQIRRTIERMNGEVLSIQSAQGEELPGVLLVQIPAEAYAAFIGELDRLGDLGPHDREPFTPAPGGNVRLRLNISVQAKHLSE